MIISAAPTAIPVIISPTGLVRKAVPTALITGITAPSAILATENIVLTLLNTPMMARAPPLRNVNPYPNANDAILNDVMPATARPMYLTSVGCFSANSARLLAALPNMPTTLLIAGSNVAPTLVVRTAIWFFNSCRLFSVVADRAANSRCIDPAYSVSFATRCKFAFSVSSPSTNELMWRFAFSPNMSFIIWERFTPWILVSASSTVSIASVPLPDSTSSV